MMDDVDK